EEDDMEIGGLVRNKTTIAEGKRRHKAFMANFPKMQFERALSKAVEGRATPEDIGYVFRHASDFGQTENVGQEKEVAVIIFDKDINL
ncbi:MAG: hypothetical protein U1E54_00795, partial [Candidatus Levybacteria bacterium]|nr:hypothetical protein [Candidatus Levybacteria bacterium]